MNAWRRLVPSTLFGRLLLLLMVCVVTSHMLALTLMFELRPGGPPPEMQRVLHQSVHQPMDGPLQERPHPPGPPGWGLLLDIGIRMAALTFAAWIGARWLSRPMKQLANAAQALGNDVHGAPLVEAGPSECRETTRVFNQMQKRIRHQLDERDQFVAAVSHDLRTPLTRLSLRIEELASPQTRDRLQGDVREMDEMIAATLDYLRGEADEEQFVPMDLLSLMQGIADDEAETGADVVALPMARIKPVNAQPIALRRAVRNMVQNAVCYGGNAQIALHDDGDFVRIEVSDTGPGLPEHELERVLMPFYRLETSRNRQSGGAGLGLAIVNGIAQRHGGSLVLANRNGDSRSGGLSATLSLPRGGPATRSGRSA